jgi:hypothetical protein
MQKLEFNNKQYNIPQTWFDVTFEQYLKFTEFVKLSNIGEDADIDPIFFYSRVFKTLTGDNINFYDAPFKEFVAFKNAVNFITTPIDKIPNKKTIETKNTFVVQKNLEDMTFGEYVDINAFAAKQTIDNQLKVIAVMVDVYEKPNWKKLRFRKRLKNMTLEEKVGYISSLPAVQIDNIYAFFLDGQKRYTTNLVSSLNKQVALLSIKLLFRLVGVFIYGSWKHAKKTLLRWMKLSKNHTGKY